MDETPPLPSVPPEVGTTLKLCCNTVLHLAVTSFNDGYEVGDFLILPIPEGGYSINRKIPYLWDMEDTLEYDYKEVTTVYADLNTVIRQVILLCIQDRWASHDSDEAYAAAILESQTLKDKLDEDFSRRD